MIDSNLSASAQRGAEQTSDLPPDLIFAAAELLGAPMAPTALALERGGYGKKSKQALWRMRVEQRMPLRETQIGRLYFVTAADFARAFFTERAAPKDAAPPRRGPGRPRLSDRAARGAA